MDTDRWMAKVWGCLDKHFEDDNVVLPALEALQVSARVVEEATNEASTSEEASASRRLVLKDAESADLLQKVLEHHSHNASVQTAGWQLLAELAAEELLQPLLVQRHGIRFLARRLERSRELTAEAQEPLQEFLRLMADVPGADAAQRTAPTGALGLAAARAKSAPRCSRCGKPSPAMLRCGRCQQAQYCGRECQRSDWKDHKAACEPPGAERKDVQEAPRAEARPRFCETATQRLAKAMEDGDTMVLDRTLRLLAPRLRSEQPPYDEVERCGLGRLLGQLVKFEGDPDIPDLARNVVREVARLQSGSR